MASITERIYSGFKSGFDAFMGRDPTYERLDKGPSVSYRPDRRIYRTGSERTIVQAIFNMIAIDCASLDIKKVQTDEDGLYVGDINDEFNECLNVGANCDQTGYAFRIDIFETLLDEGHIAIFPTITNGPYLYTDNYDIRAMRVGRVVRWMPHDVEIDVYDERVGRHNNIIVPKTKVALVQNPFYSVMNETNSVAKRLMRKLAILDVIDEQASSGKLDLIIQLPYVVKGKTRRDQAQQRVQDIQDQLTKNKLGIAYTDGTERITQLNRSVENNIMKQIEYYTDLLKSQLGITDDIMNGTANDVTMTNYYNRRVEPVVRSVVDEMKYKFISRNARTRGQSIMYFRDPFKLVSVTQLPDLVDKLGRNEMVAPNEMRPKLGFKPSKDPAADELRNRNISQANQMPGAEGMMEEGDPMQEASANAMGEYLQQ